MTDRQERLDMIESEFNRFMDFPHDSDRRFVTSISAKMFAEHMMGHVEVATVNATRLDPHHATLRRTLAELTGAARATLEAIHRAGGYHVCDPRHQPAMQTAIQALEAATVAATHHAGQPMHPEAE